MLGTFVEFFFNYFLPSQCYRCKKMLRNEEQSQSLASFLCPPCESQLPWVQIETTCPQCGTPWPQTETKPHFCRVCHHNNWFLDRAYSVLQYRQEVQDWILRFKFGRQSHLYRFLAVLIQESPLLEQVLIEPYYVVPIPLHPKRLRHRGFNQSLLLAYELTRHSPWKQEQFKPSWLRRIRHTKPQVELQAAERRTNLRQAFMASKDVYKKQILLFDDVMTTGATLNEAAHCLKLAGAKQVCSLTLAKKV